MTHPTDIHVGERLRRRRDVMGLSQSDIGERLGLSFQQIQKYERGANRISASKLYDLAKILNVTPNYFFDGLDDLTPVNEVKSSQELQLLQGYRSLKKPAKKSLVGFIQGFAA